MFSTWYQSHIQRTLARQEQTPPLRPARAPPSQPSPAGIQGNKDADTKTKYESVFGPNIGSVKSGPAWTQIKEKKVLVDELTADVVQGWIEKSKDTTQPTTTLQALVNLKRPTLRLSPLAPSSEAVDDVGDTNHHHHHHGLEFEFDCDAPKCGIYVHVHLLPEHPEATGPSSTPTKILIYESIVEGGFGKALKISDGAILELGRYDVEQIQAEANLAEPSDPDVAENAPPVEGAVAPSSESNTNSRHARRRFTNFHFRRRTHAQNRSVAGPALAVLDAEPAGSPGSNSTGEEGEKDRKDKDQDKQGARVTIRLAALDEQGAELSSPNEQVTYLHILRFGVKPAPADGVDGVEDTRPWVVKVVKREATIGPHTFQLHEIFGLSSSSKTSHTPAPTAPLPTASPISHTYPPTTATPPAATPAIDGHDEEDPSSECLVCLSSPREVVLLPCRHLVACKDCAVNMVEFGAGGNITHTEEPAPATNGTEPNANDDGNNPTGETTETDGAHVPPTLMTPPPPVTARRKRKPKGWFCPVCRQPYTSLLRLTTSPLPPRLSGPEEGENSTSTQPSTVPGETPPTRPGFSFRPSFLRPFPRSPPMADVENQIGPVRA
ncbi:E3 ubiquitin-protein ligase MGRN1/RNF157-like protein [Pleurotus pulmonarius]